MSIDELLHQLRWSPDGARADRLGNRLAELRSLLRSKEPEDLAAKSGITYQSLDQEIGQFSLQFWQQPVIITFPDLTVLDSESGDQLGESSQAHLLYYLITCDGTPTSGEWISFSELPDGRFYNQAYQGYTGGKLAQVFRNDFEAFCQVSDKLGGNRVYLLGDAAFEFQVLPLVSLLVLTWRGDEDFDASYQILFDAAVEHHLPTDACAILGSSLTHRLTAGMESLNENRH